MQVELHVQPGAVADRAAMIEFARRVVPLEHPALVKILDVCLDDAGCAVLVTPAAAGPRWELNRIASLLIDPATACSIGLSLAEALDYLHRVQLRGGMSLSWDESVRAVPSRKWELATGPDAADPRAASPWPTPQAGSPAWPGTGHRNCSHRQGAIPNPASDSFTLGALLFELLTGERLVRAKALDADHPRAACRRISQGFRSAPGSPRRALGIPGPCAPARAGRPAAASSNGPRR